MALSKKYPVVRMILFFLLNIFDAISTYCFIRMDGSTKNEANPIARWLIDRGWEYALSVKIIIIVIALIILAHIYRHDRTIGGIIATIIVVIYSIAAINNSIYIITRLYW